MFKSEIEKMLKKHELWLEDKKGGERANFKRV